MENQLGNNKDIRAGGEHLLLRGKSHDHQGLLHTIQASCSEGTLV